MTKPAKVRVEKKGARPFGPVSMAATDEWRTRPWPFTLRAGPAISVGGPIAEETFVMTNDEEPVEKALMASSSVAVTSKDSANSNFAISMAPAESLLGKETFVWGSINAFVKGNINAEWSESVARNSATFTDSRTGYSKNGVRYAQ